jgi:hypothetical protein
MKKLLDLNSKKFISILLIFFLFILILPIYLKVNKALTKLSNLQNDINFFFDENYLKKIIKINKKKFLILDVSNLSKEELIKIIDSVEQ